MELAVKFDVSQSTIAAWESGSRYPGLYHLHCIHDLFQVDLDRLIYGRVKPPTPMYARNLQYLRKKHGITQIDIARLLGVSKATSCKYENGEAVEGYLPNMPTHFMLIPKVPDDFKS